MLLNDVKDQSSATSTEGDSIPIQGGGSTGELIRNYDWFKTSLGEAAAWPPGLQSALGICLHSNFPIAIYWGPELILLYNDAWSPIPGNKHPWALGKPASLVWPEIWTDIEPQFQKAFSGIAGGSKDALLPMQRHGYTEECYFDFTFTPIFGESGKVEGVFNAVIETTYRVINERRAGILQKLGDAINAVNTWEDVFERTSRTLDSARADISFYGIFLLDTGDQLALQTCSDNFPGAEALIRETPNNLIHLNDLGAAGMKITPRHWPEPPNEAVISPLKGTDGSIMGYLIAGLSARRKFDKDYRSFIESLTNIIAGELNTIKSLDDQKKIAGELAQIDKAKTVFFSNISHELRTPLTLMLSPLESVLETATYLDAQHRNDLETSLRNSLRLQKLVNTLLDFSRIEAGKMSANFQLVNIGKLTLDLASSFRSAIENAGIKYSVRVEHINSEVAVDIDMWEKIVLNLISNAFKYTKSGEISVMIRQNDSEITLEVKDTGVGINPKDSPRIFERFYRAHNSGGRSQEGTGIGLSLVRELVHMHKGEISVVSSPGQGSTFTVTIPILRRPTARRMAELKENFAVSRSNVAFIEEASHWNSLATERTATRTPHITNDTAKILVADDNADMRNYLQRLLAPHFDVRTAINGEHAFSIARSWSPELILSDIMMPELDGFGLLKKLKSNLATRNIPLIFLSARAGEEAKVEGIQAGADDYLVKPFSAKELMARIQNQILISRVRRETEKQFYNLFLQSPAHIHVMKGPEHMVEFFHPLGRKFIGRDITGMTMREALPEFEGKGYFEILDQVYRDGIEIFLPESKAIVKDSNGDPEEHYFNITYLPWRGLDKEIKGVLQFTFDVSEQVKARKVLEEAEYKLQNAIELANLGTWHIDIKTQFVTYSKQIATWWGLSEEGADLDAVIDCIHPEDQQKVSEAVNSAITGSGFYTAEYRLLNAKTKRKRFIIAHGKVFYDADGNPVRMSGISRDITLEKSAQKELERLVVLRTRELSGLNEELKRSNDELSQFAYVASHDLQEPLRKIQTFSQMIKGNSFQPEYVQAYIDKIDKSAARMSMLIKDVLLYSQLSSNGDGEEKVDLNEILQNVVNDFELLLYERSGRIESTRLPILKGSTINFNQLFGNLISNSIKFCKNAPLIRISHSILDGASINHPRADEHKGYHLLRFEDNGIGFDPSHADQIFRLFTRLHNRNDYNGTGIGLAICKKIVESSGGFLTAESEAGKGATFSVYFPST